VYDFGTWEHLEGVQSGSGSFEKFGAGPVSWAVQPPPGGQITGRRSNRPVQSEQVFALC
jgi:hypothetical protein